MENRRSAEQHLIRLKFIFATLKSSKEHRIQWKVFPLALGAVDPALSKDQSSVLRCGVVPARSAVPSLLLLFGTCPGRNIRSASGWRNNSKSEGQKTHQERMSVRTQVGNGLTYSDMSPAPQQKSRVLLLYYVLKNILNIPNPTWIYSSFYT